MEITAQDNMLEDLMLETSVLNALKEVADYILTLVHKLKNKETAKQKGEPLYNEDDITIVLNSQIKLINLFFDYFNAKTEITKLKIGNNKKDYKIDVQ